jgi:hypothetical protein
MFMGLIHLFLFLFTVGKWFKPLWPSGAPFLPFFSLARGRSQYLKGLSFDVNVVLLTKTLRPIFQDAN